MKPILDFDILMEEYESDLIYEIPNDLLAISEMTDTERRFLNGLIRYHRPTRILEIGVSGGGGSLIILNAINDNPNASLTSIDIAHTWCYDNSKPIGWAAMRLYDHGIDESNWRLVTGKDPVEVMDSFDILFDFCVIDTAHLHPAESLNFLTTLPYLSEGAVVVLHDIALYSSFILDRRYSYSTKLLFDCVVADKLLPSSYSCSELYFSPPNIGAFQIISDTGKYISDVFSMLSFPWNYTSELLYAHYYYFTRYYDKDCVLQYQRALKINIPHQYIRQYWKHTADKNKLVFYGAGQMCKYLIEISKICDLRMPDVIWDIDADASKKVGSVPVVKPKFDSSDNMGCCPIVITIKDKRISNSIYHNLKKAGFLNVYSWIYD